MTAFWKSKQFWVNVITVILGLLSPPDAVSVSEATVVQARARAMRRGASRGVTLRS